MPDTGWLPLTPCTFARPKRTGLVSVTPGTRSRRSSTAGEKGEKPSVFCTTNAALRLSSTALAIVVLMPAAKIDTNATSATPTMRAAAVEAQRGVRRERAEQPRGHEADADEAEHRAGGRDLARRAAQRRHRALLERLD